MPSFTCTAPGGALCSGGDKDRWHRLGWSQGALEGFARIPPRALLQDFDDSVLLQDLGMKGF